MSSARVVELMKSGDEAMCAAGADALWEHSADGKDDEVMAASGVDALLAAMTAHTSSAAVCEQSTGALWSLIYDSAERRSAVECAGFVPLLAAAFRNHDGDARYEAHLVLETLGYTDDGKKK